MAVLIDHTAYPGVINLIISHAPTTALFKLHLASTAFRTRIDAALAEHAVVAADGKLHLPHSDRFSPGPSIWILHAGPAAVRTLDMDCTPPLADSFRPFTSVTTVRRLSQRHNGHVAALPPSTPTLVDFIDVLPPLSRLDIHLSPADRHIIHLRVWDLHTDTSLGVKIHPVPNLGHIVVVLSSSTNLRIDREAMSMVSSVLMDILQHRPPRMSVVGMERVALLVPLPNPTGNAIVDRSWKLLGPFLYLVSGNVDLRNLEFESWWDGLGEDERRLVGPWPDEWSDSVRDKAWSGAALLTLAQVDTGRS
ncbi:uncharacterized protein LOC62_04G005323 [Vanrija pseudolonga]|uniref:Uncharacterized protein n=1 Tax=Vanrija pseudolonga TaxID=143232 RepID=A0AAF0Y8D3_9TREE|nr:hypothetical protein LOC62_04G005323 [Vanrija pseudolonga]